MEGLLHDGYYLTGWTLIPPNMMPHHGEGGRGIFHPVDALDCAGFRGAGQGVLVARATYDANHCVHPVSVSHHLAAEGDLTVGAHIFAELLLLGDEVMNKHGNVTIVDGGPSLEGQTAKQLPKVQVKRCDTHLKDMLNRTPGNQEKSMEILIKLGFFPKSKKGEHIADKLI